MQVPSYGERLHAVGSRTPFTTPSKGEQKRRTACWACGCRCRTVLTCVGSDEPRMSPLPVRPATSTTSHHQHTNEPTRGRVGWGAYVVVARQACVRQVGGGGRYGRRGGRCKVWRQARAGGVRIGRPSLLFCLQQPACAQKQTVMNRQAWLHMNSSDEYTP